METDAERGWLARWERFWFGEASLVRLAVFRIVLLVAAFDGVWLVRKPILQRAEQLDPVFLRRTFDPLYAFDLLGLGPPGPVAVHVVWGVLITAIVLGILGLFTRLACAVVALLVLYWIGSEYSFSKAHHTCVALVFGLCALPLAPVGERLSLDSLLRRLRAARQGGDALAVPERAPWAALPLRLTQLTIAIGYFFAGATKLAESGLQWANGYTLQGIMVEHESPWSQALTGSHAVLVAMSAGLLLGQTAFPLVFLGATARWILVPLAIVFHVMAMQTMATGTFLTLLLALSAFVALERVPEFLRRRVGAGPAWRQLALGVGLAALAWSAVALYLRAKPAWLLVPFLPVAWFFLLAARPRILPAIEVIFDPVSRPARCAAAWIAAFDWARRVELCAVPGAGPGLRVRRADGSEQPGSRALGSVLVRLPCAPLLAPYLWRVTRAAHSTRAHAGDSRPR